MKKCNIIVGVAFFLISSIIIYARLFLFDSDMNGAVNNISEKRISSLPVLAGICDIIGEGQITNIWQNDEGIIIAVDNYWCGDPGSDILFIKTKTNQIPIINTPIVFFLTSHYGYSYTYTQHYSYNYVLNENKRNTLRLRSEGPVFFYDDRSWLYSNDTNIVLFASNLVVAAKSNNTNMFYEVVRDGYHLNPVDSRIVEDSYFAFEQCKWFFTTNFIQQIWNDPLLTDGNIRDDINFNYYMMTGEYL